MCSIVAYVIKASLVADIQALETRSGRGGLYCFTCAYSLLNYGYTFSTTYWALAAAVMAVNCSMVLCVIKASPG